MNNFIIYSIEIAISIALFYTAYWVFLRKETFFKLNRYYMIFSVVVSLFTPLMNITVGQDSFIARNLILPIKQYEQSISVNLDSKYLSKRNKMLLPENMVTKEGSITTKATEESNTMSNSAQTSTMDSLGASEIGKTINWLSIIGLGNTLIFCSLISGV